MNHPMCIIQFRIIIPCVLQGFLAASQDVTRSLTNNRSNEINEQTTSVINDTDLRREKHSTATATNNPQIVARTMSHLELLNNTIISRLIDHQERFINTTKSDINNDGKAPLELVTVSTPALRLNTDNKTFVSNKIPKHAVISNRSIQTLNQTSQSNGHSKPSQSKILTKGQTPVILPSFGSTSKSSSGISLLSTVLTAAVTVLPTQTLKSTIKHSTEATSTTTKRAIYIRGHKLQGHKTKILSPDYEPFESPASMIAKHGYPTHHIKPPCWPDCDGGFFDIPEGGTNYDRNNNNTTPSRSKRKHYTKPESWKVFNHKITGHKEDFSSNKEGTAKVYGWIIGAAMLSVGSLVSLTGGVLLCFCGDKIKKRREERRRLEKYGEYERVESVSSLVSTVHPNDLYDDHLESVSMI